MRDLTIDTVVAGYLYSSALLVVQVESLLAMLRIESSDPMEHRRAAPNNMPMSIKICREAQYI